MKFKNILLNNIGLKLLALLFAFVTWFYVAETTKPQARRTVLQKLFAPAYYVSKRLDVRPVFKGAVPEGYVLVENKVKVIPESMVILGPSNLLAEKEHIYTKPIDLSEHTKTRTVPAELRDLSRSTRMKDVKVEVLLPIEKLPAKAEK